MAEIRHLSWLPGERAVEVSPRFTPRVGDPHPRRLNFVAGRTLTEQALNTEQRHRDRRFTLLGRALAPGIIEGLEVRLNSGAAGSAEIRVSPGIGLTADGEDIALRRAMVARIADIPPARALIEERLEPRGVVVLSLQPIRAVAALEADPDDPCPVDPDAYAYADLVTQDGVRLVWSRLDDDAPAELPPLELAIALREVRIAAPRGRRRPPVLSNAVGRLTNRNVLIPPNPLLGRAAARLVPLTVLRNTTAARVFEEEAAAARRGAAPRWADHGLPVALLNVSSGGEVIFLDRFSVARFGGAPPQAAPSARMGLPPELRRARFDQFIEHLQDLRTEGAPLAPASQHFRTLPPVGILPATMVDFETMRSAFFPPSYLVEAAPVPLEQLEAVLSARSGLEPFDLARRDYVQFIVPVPEHLYEPRLLLRDEMLPDFRDAIDEATIEAAHYKGLLADLHGMEAAVVGLIDIEAIASPAPVPPVVVISDSRFEDKARAHAAGLFAGIGELPLSAAEREAIDPERFDAMVSALTDPAGGAAGRKGAIFRGLKPVVEALTARLEKANDFIDLSFLRLHADIYRARKNLAGEDDVTRLATSPVLAHLAATTSGLETSRLIKAFFDKQKDPPKPATHPELPKKVADGDSGGGGVGSPILAMRFFSPPPLIFAKPVTGSFVTASNMTMIVNTIAATSATSATAAMLSSSALTPAAHAIIGNQFTAAKASLAVARLQASTIAWQGLVYGKAAPVRTLTIAERLRASPAQEAKNGAVATKAEIVRGIQDLGLNLAGLPLPVGVTRVTLVEKSEFDRVKRGFADDTRTVLEDDLAAPKAGDYVLVSDRHLAASAASLFPDSDDIQSEIAEATRQLYEARAGLDAENLAGLILADLLDPDPPDADEAAFYGAAVDALESAVSTLRQAESRIHAYQSFLDQVRDALLRAYELSETWQGAIEEAEAELAEALHDQAVATALFEEEDKRIKGINQRRQDILAQHVEIVAFARPRTIDRFAQSPGMDLYATLEDPIPACLEGSVEPPEELEEMVDALRDAPVGWFPTLAGEIGRIDRARRLRDAWERARDRARRWLDRHARDLRRTGIVAPGHRVAGKGATGVRLALGAARARWAAMHRARAERSLADLGKLGWRTLRDRATAELSMDDLAGAGRAGAALAREGLRELGQIASVAGCFLETLRQTPAEIRLGWAETLSVHDDPPDLSVIARARDWSSIPFEERRLLEHLHRWLFSRVDRKNPDARAAMSEIVRVCLLLASHAPVSAIIEGAPADSSILSLGETFEVSVSRGEAAAGMAVTFIDRGKRGLGVVEDIVGTKALIRLTHVPQGQIAITPRMGVRFSRQVQVRLMSSGKR